jgi:cytochrome P450
MKRISMIDSPKTSASSPPERPPQVPTRVPWLGHGLAFGRDPIGLIESCKQRYGDVFSLKFPGGRRTLLLDPHDYPAYFKDKRLRFGVVGEEIGQRAFGYDLAKSGTLDMEQMTHHSGQLLKGKHLELLGDRMQQLFAARLARPGNSSGQLLGWIQEHLFAAGGDALCGEGFYSPQTYRDYLTVDRYFPLLLAGVPAGLLRGCVAARRRLATEAGKKRPGRAHVMEVRDEEYAQTGAPPDQIDLHHGAWIWASQVNTLNAAFWALLFVLQEPGARRAIEEEVRDACGAEPPGGTPFGEAGLRKMVGLDSAISEALRLASGPMATRRVMEPLELTTVSGRTFHFDRGENIDLFPYLTHFDPEIYEEPRSFRYDRFLSKPNPPQFFKGGKKVVFPLLPFGAGASRCPGRFFATNEVKIVVALLLGYFDIELNAKEPPPLDFSRMGLGVLPPKHDVSFTMRRR